MSGIPRRSTTDIGILLGPFDYHVQQLFQPSLPRIIPAGCVAKSRDWTVILERLWLNHSDRRSSSCDISHLGSSFVLSAGIFVTPFRIGMSENCWWNEAWRLTMPRSGNGFSRHRAAQYLNNILEQDHRAIKKRIRAKQHFPRFGCARRTIQGYEVMHKIRKGQVRWVKKGDVRAQNQFIDRVFCLAS